MTFLDKTFCASPACINKCGRKMTGEEKKKLEEYNKSFDFSLVSYSIMCDENGEAIELKHIEDNKNEK